MKKAIISLSAFVICLCMLTACGSKPEKSNTNAPDPTSSSETPANTSGNDGKKEETKERTCDADEALYHADSKDGHFIRNNSFVIDSKGYLVFVLPQNEENTTKVYNGLFLSKDDKNGYLRKATGEIVTSTETLDGAKLLLDSKYSFCEKMLKDGYVLAYRIKENYNGVKYEIGVLNTKGEWIAPLSEDNAIIKSGFDVSETALSENLRYAGSGLIQFKAKTGTSQIGIDIYDYCLYDVTTNSISKLTFPESVTEVSLPSKEYLAEEFEFINGVARFYATASGWAASYPGIYVTGKNGNVEKISFSTVSSVSDIIGNIYYAKDQNKYIYLAKQDKGAIMVVDSQGNVIKSLDDIEMITSDGFIGDTAQLTIKNNEGTVFYTVIDTKGEFLFDPVKLDDIAIVFDAEGRSISTTSTSAGISSGKSTFIDNTGKILLTTDFLNYTQTPSVSNGVACYIDGAYPNNTKSSTVYKNLIK